MSGAELRMRKLGVRVGIWRSLGNGRGKKNNEEGEEVKVWKWK